MSRRKPNTHRSQTNSRVSLGLWPAAVVGLCLSLLGCGEDRPGDILTVDVRAGEAHFTLASSPAAQNYLLVPFSAPSTTASGRQNYSVDMALSSVEATEDSVSTQSLTRSPDRERLLNRFRSQDQRQRAFSQALEEAWQIKQSSPWLFQQYFDDMEFKMGSPRAAISGNLELFSPFDGETNLPISGTLRAYSDEVAVYVDTRDNAQVSEEEVSEILNAYGDISLPRLKAIFGETSDVDGNQRLHLFLASANRFAIGELGFFRPLDLLPDGASQTFRSNQQEIMYVQVPSPEVPIELVHATLTHETFHLINFASKSLPMYQNTQGIFYVVEDLFLNEGQAHLAEELVGWGVDTPLVVQIFLECLEYTSLAGDGMSNLDELSYCEVVGLEGDSLPRRGGVMIFLLYLFQQLGGATYSPNDVANITGPGVDFLRALNTSSQTGITNLEQATGRSFFDMYKNFAGLLALDQTGQSASDVFSLHDEVSDPFTTLTRNVRLRSSRVSAFGEPVLLEGPSLFKEVDLTSTMQINGNLFVSGMNFMRITVPAHTQVDFTFEGSSALYLGVNLIPVN